jgi:hypothetical protein
MTSPARPSAAADKILGRFQLNLTTLCQESHQNSAHAVAHAFTCDAVPCNESSAQKLASETFHFRFW